MDEQTQKMILAICAVWGASVSTILGMIKLWETFWRDRIRLVTSYYFCGHEDIEDRISVANLSPKPIQISYWKLCWEPRFWSRIGSIDMSPYDDDDREFSIAAHGKHTLHFSQETKLDWSLKTRTGRQLFLYLHMFGRKKPYKLRVYS